MVLQGIANRHLLFDANSQARRDLDGWQDSHPQAFFGLCQKLNFANDFVFGPDCKSRHFRQSKQLVTGKAIQRPVYENPQIFLLSKFNCGAPVGLVFFQDCARLHQVGGQLYQPEVMPGFLRPGDFPEGCKAGKIRLIGGGRECIGADPVILNTTPGDFFFHKIKGDFYTAIVFCACRLQGGTVFCSPFEIVFGIMQQVKIQRFQAEALQAAS